jgi:heterodisulfide reductase subunit B
MQEDEVKRGTINDFMDEEPDYAGEVRVVHLLDFLRDDFGFDKLKAKVKKPLGEMKVAPYYGCTILRPDDVALDSADNPTLMHEFLEALGATAVEFPGATQCCGSYNVLGDPEAALAVSHDIIQDASKHEADALSLACPLCDYNLGHRQEQMLTKYDGAKEVPVYYFTQLMAIALGLDPEVCQLDLNRDSSANLLKSKNLVTG